MAENSSSTEAAASKVIAVNKQLDLGALVFEDSSSYQGKTEEEILEATKKNFCSLFKELFDLKKQQRAKLGDDGEILEYTKALNTVQLPEPKIVVPRAKPAPKEKPKTKWEKFREEKGLPARKKRSRLVFDPITNDWVPRWGPNSKKKIESKHEWLLEDKGNAKEGDADPFTVKRQEKKLQLEKENLRRMKNEMHALKEIHGKSSIRGVANEILNNNKNSDTNNRKAEEEQRKQTIKKRERKALDKSLQLA